MNYENKGYIKRETIFNLLRTEIGSLIAVNILFIITCIPIFTIGTSLLTMQKIILELIEGKKVHVFSEYFPLFKKYFFDGIKLFLYVLVLFGILIFASYYYFSISKLSLAYEALSVFSILVMIISLVSLSYLTQMLVLVDIKFFQSIKNSWIFTFSCGKQSGIALLSIVTIMGLSTIFIQYLFPVVIILSFSLCNACCTEAEIDIIVQEAID